MKTALLALLISVCLLAQVAPNPQPNGGALTSETVAYLTWLATVANPQTGFFGDAYRATSNGMVCDNVTDDTAALNALISRIYIAHGGVIYIPQGKCLIAGAVALPNDNIATNQVNPYSRQPYLRITGAGDVRNGQGQSPGTTYGGSVLRMTYSGALGKIATYGLGALEIDHLTLWDDSGASTPFIFTTGTTLNIHENSFIGSKSGTAADQDAIILGGTCPLCTSTYSNPLNDTDDAFQGYDTHIWKNYFNKIRRVVYARTWVASTHIDGNMIGPQCGSNQTRAITAASNANPVSFTAVGHGFPTGGLAKTVPVVISGATGGWTSINGTQTATITGVDTFTIAVDSTSFGALAGSPVYPIGAAMEFDGHWVGNNTVENQITNNRCEITGYVFCMKFIGSQNNYIAGTDVEDAQAALNTAIYSFDSASSGNMAFMNSSPTGGTSSITVANKVIDANGANTIIDSSASSTSYLANGVSGTTLVNAFQTRSTSVFGLPFANVATNSNNYPASTVTIRGSYWDGSAAQNDNWTWTHSVGAGSNPTTQVSFGHTGSSGTATVLFPTQVKFGSSQQSNMDATGSLNLGAGTNNNVNGTIFNNNNPFWFRTTTAATGGANQSGQLFYLSGRYWNGSADTLDYWNMQNVLGSGSNPTTTLTVNHVGSSGSASITTGAFTLQSGVTATDPGCTTTAHVGKLWFDITTTTTAFKVCTNVSGTVGWATK